MSRSATNPYRTGAFRRYLMLFLLAFGGYLCQVCLMPSIRILGVTPNLLYAVIGIVTVAYGKLRAFWVGLTFGLLMEIMIPSVPYFYLFLYPVTTLFCFFAFADKPLKTLEYERAFNQKSRSLPPWLRSVACTALNIFAYEVVNVTYIYLGGTTLTLSHFGRAATDILITTVLCFLLQFPIRRMIFGRKPDPSQTSLLTGEPLATP